MRVRVAIITKRRVAVTNQNQGLLVVGVLLLVFTSHIAPTISHPIRATIHH